MSPLPPSPTLARLVPGFVTVVESFGDPPYDLVPPPTERAVAERLAPGRRREFLSGRDCARQALDRAGFPDSGVGVGPQREPVWPNGAVGSITHCTGYRAAAVTTTTRLRSLGIDAEPHVPIARDTASLVLTDHEQDDVSRLTRESPLEGSRMHWETIVYSAKESAYKAWFPLTRKWLDFADVRVHLEVESGAFQAHVLADGSTPAASPPLEVICGRYAVSCGVVLSAAWVNAA